MQCPPTKAFCCFVVFYAFFTSSLFGQEIRYFKGDIKLQEVQQFNSEKWSLFEREIYSGFDNGLYWFKIDFPPTSESKILTLPESHITRAFLFYGNQEIQPLRDKRYITFKLPKFNNKATYYLKVDCKLEASIPIIIKNEQEFITSENNQFLIIGLYYGIVFSILCVNFFSFLSFSEKTYLHYMLMVFGMAANAFYKDGTFALLFGREGINEVIEPTINSIVPISAILFVNSYIQIKKYRPKLFFAIISIIVIAQVFNLILITQGVDLFWFILTDFTIMLSLDVYWLVALSLWKRSYYVKFFVIAYGIPLFIAHDFYIYPPLGVKFLNLDLNWYKIGSVFEMIVFTYAIMYKTKRINSENRDMRKKIMSYVIELQYKQKELHEKATAMIFVKTFGFTLRETEILQGIALQKTNKEIAKEHFISINTVKTHIRNIFNKLEVNSKKEAGEHYKTYLATDH